MSIAVTGATGQLGRLVIDELLRADVPASQVVAVVRDATKATHLSDRGVGVRQADYNDRPALRQALAGVDRLLLISTPGNGAAAVRHANVIDAAVAAGVGHVAYTSILHAATSSNPLAVEHAATERLVAASGLAATLLRNAYYTELYTSQIHTAAARGVLVGATGDGRISAATRADFAAAAAAVMTEESPATSATAGGGAEPVVLELGGPSFSLADLARAITEVTGTLVEHRDLSADDLVADLESSGADPGSARFAAAADASVAAGQMHTDSTALAELVARPLTALEQALQQALRQTA